MTGYIDIQNQRQSTKSYQIADQSNSKIMTFLRLPFQAINKGCRGIKIIPKCA
jgi:hypothetical protein